MKDSDWKELRQRLIDRRTMLGMTQTEVADRSGITQSTISAFEGGRAGPPTDKTIVKWAGALRMTARTGLVLDCPEYREPFVIETTPEDQP